MTLAFQRSPGIYQQAVYVNRAYVVLPLHKSLLLLPQLPRSSRLKRPLASLINNVPAQLAGDNSNPSWLVTSDVGEVPFGDLR